MAHPVPSAPRLPARWLGPLLIAAAFIGMAAWTWNKWPDILVDFGRELYIAWQLSEGKHLYTDIAYYSGPLSPHLNALWFKLFGVGLRTLTTVNLVLLAAFFTLLYRMLADIAGRFATTIGCLVFVLLFAFAQYVGIGNYNWVCPYSHDAIHGVMLAVLSLFLLKQFRRRRQIAWLMGAGLALGLVFLTRAEVFVAATAAVGATWLATLWKSKLSWRQSVAQAAILLTGLVLPPLVALSLLARHMPLAAALTGTLGTWPSTVQGKAAAMPYIRDLMGIAQPIQSLNLLGEWAARFAVLASLLFLIARFGRASGPLQTGVRWGLFAASAGILLYVWWNNPPIEALRPLPLLVAILAAGCLLALRRKSAPEEIEPALLALGLSVFALVILGKVILNVRIYHYGFFMAMPGVVLLVVALCGWVPAWTTGSGGDGNAFRAGILGVIVAFAIVHLHEMRPYLAEKTQIAGRGADAFLADARGELVNNALHEIEQRLRPDETLVVVPEGVMLNYLSRRRNSTPHTNFMPTEMVIFGEESILDSLRRSPPDWVAFIPKDTREFGVRFFGSDYAQRIGEWILENYQEDTAVYGPGPHDEQFKFSLLRRKPAGS